MSESTTSQGRRGRRAVDQAELAAGDRRRRALRRIMACHDLTPTDWARRAGIESANMLSNFLTGRSHSLHLSMLEKLADAIPGTTIDQLSGRKSGLESTKLKLPGIPVRFRAAIGI